MTSPLFSVALFDFDGVILESAEIKVDGFLACFSDEPPAVLEAIRDYTAYHGGVSRFAKFRHIYARILRRPLSDAGLEALCDRYSELVVGKVDCAPFVRGARELLEALAGLADCFVVSGTPQDELRAIVSRRGLNRFFKDVLGSPTPKAELTRQLVAHCGRPAETVFIGDSITDYEAATAAQIQFLGVAGDERGSLPLDAEIVDDLMLYRSRFIAEELAAR